MDIILQVPAAAGQLGKQEQQDVATMPAWVELARFPAHSALLSNSDVLRSRVSIMADVYLTCLDRRVPAWS
jgi:hypothetical protein